ncbi:MAG TPA: hypothetical protein VK978_04660 [Candidatus Saccharimonadales bacterium]|nr:hypothetical protein [Candidatus Saccharimonadales bacterium]
MTTFTDPRPDQPVQEDTVHIETRTFTVERIARFMAGTDDPELLSWLNTSTVDVKTHKECIDLLQRLRPDLFGNDVVAGISIKAMKGFANATNIQAWVLATKVEFPVGITLTLEVKQPAVAEPNLSLVDNTVQPADEHHQAAA